MSKLVIGYLMTGFGTLVMIVGVILLVWQIRSDSGVGTDDFVGIALAVIGAGLLIGGRFWLGSSGGR